MARTISDLWPQVSGSASLGVEMENGGLGREIRPFANIHMNSGVFHDQHGQSGVLRFNRQLNNFQVSLDGGITFRPLVLDLQDAYDGGRDISISPANNGVIIGDPTASVLTPSTGVYQPGQTTNFILAVSGSAASKVAHDFGLMTLTPQALIINASGTGHPTNYPANLFIGMERLTPNVARIFTSGTLQIQATKTAGLVGDEGVDVVATTSTARFKTNGPNGALCILASEHGDVNIMAATTAPIYGGQIQLNAFANSGMLEYRFGPHEAWYWRRSSTFTGGPFNDGYQPIPHSGQINQMILAGGSTLQAAYNANPKLYLNRTGDDNLDIVSHEGKLRLANVAGGGMGDPPIAFQALINASGGLSITNHNHETGDLSMYAHSMILGYGNIAAPTTVAAATAKSLGVGTMSLNTGSGIANISIGSGIFRATNDGSSLIQREPGTYPLGQFAPVSGLNVAVINDLNFTLTSTSHATASGIRIWSPGLYKASYKLRLQRLDLACVSTAQLGLNDTMIASSDCSAGLGNQTSLEGTMQDSDILFNVRENQIGAILALYWRTQTSNSTLRVNSRGHFTITVEKVGPVRDWSGD